MSALHERPAKMGGLTTPSGGYFATAVSGNVKYVLDMYETDEHFMTQIERTTCSGDAEPVWEVSGDIEGVVVLRGLMVQSEALGIRNMIASNGLDSTRNVEAVDITIQRGGSMETNIRCIVHDIHYRANRNRNIIPVVMMLRKSGTHSEGAAAIEVDNG